MRPGSLLVLALALAGCGTVTPSPARSTRPATGTKCACGQDGIEVEIGEARLYTILGEPFRADDHARLVAAYGPALDTALTAFVLANADWQEFRSLVESTVAMSRTVAETEAQKAIFEARPEIIETLQLTRAHLHDATKEGRLELAIELRADLWRAYDDSAAKLAPFVIARVASNMPHPTAKAVNEILGTMGHPIAEKLAARANLEGWRLHSVAFRALRIGTSGVERAATTEAVARIVEPILADERRSWLKIMK